MPPTEVRATPFSSFGPADDGRIKPDVVANGSRLYPASQPIPGGYNPRAYVFKSGTSMATPATAGIAALLTEISLKKRGKILRADEMKPVLVHTAVPPQPGPSYRTGWGAVDALAAGEVVAGDQGLLHADVVRPDGSDKFSVRPSGGPV